MAKKKPANVRGQANYRLGEETLARIERLAERLAQELGLVEMSRSDVVRIAIKELCEKKFGKNS
jgi:D-alanine-D-alanine ligase-like ATP-grasp enzyme